MTMVKPCWTPCSYGSNENGALGRTDPLLWHKDFGYHAYGEYSMAVVQANTVLEDHSQLESGPLSFSRSGPTGTFIGIYDGHGGPEASQFVNDNLFYNFKRIAAEHNGITTTVIEEAFQETEKEFLSLVKKDWLQRPQIAATGSCCLVGIICDGMLYVANAGDSRVILGRTRRSSKDVLGLQLSTEHNASLETVRRELRSTHPCDSDIVVLKQKVWRVKGLIQISRSIGDAYLKRAEFNKAPLPSKYRLSQPILKPILSAEPTISIQRIQPEDQFLVFASDGLWEYLSNQEVTNIVRAYPRKGIAKRLVKTAMKEASNRREMRYSDLKKLESGVRRYFHDDITVAVVYLNMKLVDDDSHSTSLHSIQGGNLLLPQ